MNDRMLIGLGLCGVVATGCDWRQAAKDSTVTSGPDVSGEWRSGASVYRLTTDGRKVTVVFETVSPEGQALGFKAGDLSFEGTRKGNFIQGEEMLRYPSNVPCHQPGGRRVPFIGMIAADGRRMVIDWYNVSVNVQSCEDVDRTVANTLLERGGK